MKLLNLGCGSIYHPAWTNIDFVKRENVIQHNLLNGIPFQNNEFDVVFHSHVLEHFNKKDAESFMIECYRVLKSNGIIRIVVPDLENIAKTYIEKLNEVWNEPSVNHNLNYDWMLLEMYDQTVRNYSGGYMKDFLEKKREINKEYIIERIGLEARKAYNKSPSTTIPHKYSFRNNVVSFIKMIINTFTYKSKWFQALFKKQIKYYSIGKFRHSGEIHQWMYDKYSLKRLLETCGFTNIIIKSAFESNIENWNSYELDSKNGEIFSPNSLFMEATKK